MASSAFFELSCPRCGLSRSQMLPDDGAERTFVRCPNDGEELVKGRRSPPGETAASGPDTPKSG